MLNQMNYHYSNQIPMQQQNLNTNTNTMETLASERNFQKHGFQKLAECQAICIKQKYVSRKEITGLGDAQYKRIYPSDANGNIIASELFKIKPFGSNVCTRLCLTTNCRPYHIKISECHAKQNQYLTKQQTQEDIFFQMERPFKCTCLCLPRSDLTVLNQNTILGKIKNSGQLFSMFSIGSRIEDAQSSCFQAGYLCKGCCCSTCQEFFFEIKTPTNEIVATLQKKPTSSCSNFCFDREDGPLVLTFPPNSSPEDKTLLMAASILLDCQYLQNKTLKWCIQAYIESTIEEEILF